MKKDKKVLLETLSEVSKFMKHCCFMFSNTDWLMGMNLQINVPVQKVRLR